MWAAPVNTEWMDWLWNRNKEGPEPVMQAAYPIVDNMTCGDIHGTPRVDQYLCVCFTAEGQRRLWLKLNGLPEES